MPLALHAANKLAEALATMAEFPRFRGSIEATAQDLISLFRENPDDERCEVEAAALVRDLRMGWDEWPGTAAMFAYYATNYLGQKAPAPANQAINYGEKPPIICAACNDTGVVGFPTVEWCTCPMAETLRETSGATWLEVINRPIPRVKVPAVDLPVKWDETAKDGKGGWVPV